MRSDTRALLKVLAWSGVVALVAIGVGVAAAVGWLTKEAGAVGILGCIVGGGLIIGRQLGPALTGRLRSRHAPRDEPNVGPGEDTTPPATGGPGSSRSA